MCDSKNFCSLDFIVTTIECMSAIAKRYSFVFKNGGLFLFFEKLEIFLCKTIGKCLLFYLVICATIKIFFFVV